MPKAKFNTVPTELVEHAEVAYDYFHQLGYSIKLEPYEIHYPTRPTLVCKSHHTQLVILVSGRVDIQQLQNWVSLAKSLTTDFRVAICISGDAAAKHLPKHQLKIKELGIGIYISADGKLAKFSDPVDQNIKVALPDLKSLPRAVQKVVGPAYEHFSGGRWRDCFEEACKGFEQLARPYFKKAINDGRLSVYDAAGQIRNPSDERIEKLTLGQLATELGRARPLNALDSQIQKALTQVNPDRVGLVHKNQRVATERRLRKNVGLHMHVIIQVLKELKK
ncbi:MAG: hypothetical protein V4639_04705 [Pseudomonadota bacterium]